MKNPPPSLVRALVAAIAATSLFGTCPTALAKPALDRGKRDGRTPTGFDWRADTIAFSNDTVFGYGIDEKGQLTMHVKEKPPQYAHRCFVLARAVMQFHKFARFAPEQPRVSAAEYRRLVKHVSRIPVWFGERPPDRRVVIPGYRDLNAFSRGHEYMFKETLGEWVPTYLRVGNWRMTMAFPRFGQAAAARHLTRGIDRGKLQAVYLTRFLKMNHVIVLFDYHRLPNGDLRFDAYDPNYPNELSSLLYHPKERNFDFGKRWFWPGGTVNLMRVYISPVH